MGEPIMAASMNEDKIAETVASGRSLEVSISFGRFENDTLSWEKWSTFSQNKHMEEVEKCATTGSVAQKKAYFEAHYKKIAARKAEQLDQQKIMERDSYSQDPTREACENDSEFDTSYSEASVKGTKVEAKLDNELGTGDVDEHDEDAPIKLENPVSSVAIEEQLAKLDSLTINKPEEAAVTEEAGNLSLEPHEIKGLPKKLDKETESNRKIKKQHVKSNPPKESQKISPLSKVRSMTRINKKAASPVTKSPINLTTKVSKTPPTSSNLSTSSTPPKKIASSPISKCKIPSIGRSKKVVPKSLHMSITLATPNSDSAPTTLTSLTSTRKSFIMEQMKDKEIVKRTFKSFQNNFNQFKSSAEERSLAAKQVPVKGTQYKVSSSITPRKENIGSFKAVSMDKKTAKAAPSSFGLKADDRAEKRKEFSKKMEEKSKARARAKAKEAESAPLQTKSKEGSKTLGI